MGLFVKEVVETGIYKEVYVYLQGSLIYKAWFKKGEKTASQIFHSGEGLALHHGKKMGR